MGMLVVMRMIMAFVGVGLLSGIGLRGVFEGVS